MAEQSQQVKVPKLMSPVGVYRSGLYAAVDNGADIVYVGVRRASERKSLRSELGYRGSISCFTVEEIADIVSYAKAHGVETQVALNNPYTDQRREEAKRILEELIQVGVDTVIITDPAFMKWVSVEHPEVKIHASVVVGTTNSYTAAYYRQLGASAVTLENSLCWEALKQLRASIDLKLGVFIYGITCLSQHGLCNLSEYTNGVMCVAPCNRKVTLRTDDAVLEGSYLRCRDLDLFSEIPRLAALGIDELKIEGRMRAPRYVAAATAAARYILDAWKEGRNPVLPDRLKRRLKRLPFFGTCMGNLGPKPPGLDSFAVSGGNFLNRFLEYSIVPSPRLTAHLLKRKVVDTLDTGITYIMRRGQTRPVLRRGSSAAKGSRPAPPALQLGSVRVIVETNLVNPVLPRGADRICLGEKHCTRRFLDNIDKLSFLIPQVVETGAEPFLTVPARISEDLVEDVLNAVLAFKDRVAGVYCHDLGLGAKLAAHMPVVLACPVNGLEDAQLAADRVGATALRPLRVPLISYLKWGFPKVPIELQVFGHLPLMHGIMCLSSVLARCPSCTFHWWPIQFNRSIRLRVDGNAIYSESSVSAHLIRDILARTPVGGYVIETVGYDAEQIEKVIDFWKGRRDWPELFPKSSLCNALYLFNPDDSVGRPIPWHEYREDLPELLEKVCGSAVQ